jgi:predicted permease
MGAFLHDLRFAGRTLRRAPSFAFITIATLGVGIGVLTALFAVVNAVLLRPLVPEQDRVVRVWKQDVERGDFRHALTYREFRAFRERTQSLAVVASVQASDASSLVFTIDNQPAAVAVTPVTAEFFTLVCAGQPLHGRWFDATDEAKGAELVAVASERFWREVAHGDPALVGRQLPFAAGSAVGIAGGARTLRVVGVAPRQLAYPLGTDFWVPIAGFFDGSAGRFDYEDRRFAQFEVLGRMKPEASAERVRAELELLQRRLIAEYPDDYDPMRIVVQPLVDSVVGSTRQVLTFVLVAAGLVLAVAGVNVAALLLMRAASRRRELAVRLALGASYSRLARQTVTESLLLGVMAALAGALLANVLLGVVRWLAPADVPRIEHAAIDHRVLAFCAAATLIWVATLGTVPVWIHRRVDVAPSGDLSSRGRPRTAGLRLFTVTQIAAAVVVAVGAGLLIRSFVELTRVDRGFDSTNLAVVSILLPDARYPDPPRRVAFFEQLLAEVAALPGVVAATPVHMNPGSGSEGLSAPMRFEGQTPEDSTKNPWASWDPVTPSYFRTLGVPIIEGRALTEADSADAAPVAVVSESIARRYWPGETAIGKRLRLASEFPWVTVVGVARDLRYRQLTKNWMTVYFPAAQFFFFAPTKLVVRTTSNPEALVPAIRDRIRAREPAAAVTSVTTMDALLARELSRPRVALAVTALFALVAIALAAVGAYSVMSYEVSSRGHELAVRSALGASPARLVGAVVRDSAVLASAGALAGVLAAVLVTRSLESSLHEVNPGDPRAFLVGAASLLAVVLLASFFPARRAARTDPAAVLRAE